MSLTSIAALIYSKLELVPSLFDSRRAECLLKRTVPVPTHCKSIIGRFAQAIDAYDEDMFQTFANIQLHQPALLLAEAWTTQYFSGPVTLAELPSCFQVSGVAVVPGQEVDQLMTMARSSPWPFWQMVLTGDGTGRAMRRNINNLLHAHYRGGLVAFVAAECARIAAQLDELFLSSARQVYLATCRHAKGVNLARAVDLFSQDQLHAIDRGDAEDIHTIVQDTFAEYFYSDLEELRRLQSYVARVPIEMAPEWKVACIGRDDLGKCKMVMKKLPQLHPIHRETGRDVVEVRLKNAELYKRRMRRLIEQAPEFVSQLRGVFAEVPRARIVLDVDTLLEDVNPTALRLIEEVEVMKEVLPMFAAVAKCRWNFWGFVMNIHPKFRVDQDVNNFMKVVLENGKRALMALHRKFIFDQFARVCSFFEIPAPVTLIVEQARHLAAICRQNTMFRMVQLLDGPTLAGLEAFAIRRDDAGLMVAMTELFAEFFQRKAGHVQTVAELPEEEEDRTCIVCQEVVEDVAELRLICDGKSQCCRSCLESWVRVKGDDAPCPNCRQQLNYT